MTNPSPPPPQPRLDAFLQRAAPIIARERGLSPKARILLDSLAKDMSLTADEFQQAIAIIQRGGIPIARADQAPRESFRHFLRVQFQASVTKIISAKQEQVLLALAVTQLGLQEEAAREEMRSIASELGLKRISREEAERFVDGVIAQKIAEVDQLDPATYARLQSLGNDWGLEPEAVNELIKFQLDEKFSRGRRIITWNRGLIGGSVATLAIVLVVIIYMSLGGRATPEAITESPATPNGTGGGEVTPTKTRVKPPNWWTADIAVAASTAKQEMPEFSAVYDAIIAAAPERRAQGYELMLERAGQRPFDTRKWKQIAGAMLGCFVHEPDDIAANALLAQASRMIQAVFDHLPAVPSDYEAAFRPFDALVLALRDTELPAARAVKLREELEHLCKSTFASGDEDRWDRGRSFLAAALLEKLPAELEKRPEVLTGHYAYLASVVREHAPEELAERQAMLVAAAIERTPSTYGQWKMLASQAVEVRNPLALVRMVDAWEACKQPELKDDLAPRLLARVGLLATNVPREQVASRIRESLGISRGAGVSDDSPWPAWEKQVSPLLALTSKSPVEPMERMRETVDFAWRVNLTMLLVRDPSAIAKFQAALKLGSPADQMGESKPAEEPRSTSKNTNANRSINSDQLLTLQRYAAGLEDPALEIPKRVSYLRGLAKLSEQVAEIPPASAQALAKYLFMPKSELEHEQVLEALVRMRRWKQLRLAVADELETTMLNGELLSPMIIRLTGRDTSEGNLTLASMRLWLLQNVLQELTSSEGTTSREAALDAVDVRSKQLVEIYRERARLWGVSAGETASPLASELLKACGQRLRPASTQPSVNDPSSRMQELAPVLGQSDLQRTVIMQRVLIARSLQFIAQRMPEKQTAAQKLTTEFNQRSNAASDALTQLRDGEQTLLALWMLLKP